MLNKIIINIGNNKLFSDLYACTTETENNVYNY